MSLSRLSRFVLLLLLPTVLVGLGIVAFRQALAMGSAEAWLMAWVLAFVVGLPVLLVVLTVAGAAQRLRIIPLVGVKIPGLGQ